MEVLSKTELRNISLSGKILHDALLEVKRNVKPGISGKYLDDVAQNFIRSKGARPSFLNYSSSNSRPFPSALCVSINENVVHGIPREDQIIQDGDVVGLDLGVEYGGMCSDSAITVIAGINHNTKIIKLVNITKEALMIGIKQVKANARCGDIGYAIENYVKSKGFNVVKSLVGHGIGRNPHQEPQIPNFGKKDTGPILIKNTALAIEPMVVMGGNDLRTDNDGWTVRTVDNSISAHFEHTVIVKDYGYEIIT